jgi:hypothetical protein
MASKERISAGDKALWLLGTAVTIALLLIAPKLSADITGRWATGLLLLSMFVVFALALWNLHWFHSRKILVCIGIVVVAALTSALGLWVWPSTLEATPKRVSFEAFIPHVVPNERYSFRLLNRSDDDVYAAEFDFIVDDPNAFVRDFTIDVPKDSRKPSGEGGAGAEHFVDIVGLACRDLPKHRPLFRLSWKWRKRSSVKIAERTYEKRAQALHC